MKETKKILQKKGKIFLSFLLLICICVIVFSIYSKTMKRLTYQDVYTNISELSEQTATQLNDSIQNQMKFVNIVVDFINGGYADSEEEIFKRFKPDLENYHFTRLVILDEEGNGITSDNYIVKNYPNIDEFFNQDSIYLSENRPSTVSNNQVNIYSKTFLWKGKRKVLFATINTENYQEILSRRLFNGLGGTYLVNESGSILIDSFQENNTNLKIDEYIIEKYEVTGQRDQEKVKNMKKEIQNKQTGTFDFLSKNKVHFLHYEKVNINNWYVVTIAPGSSIAKELNIFLGISLGLYLIMAFMIIIFFIYLYGLNKRKSQELYEIAYIDPITKLGNEAYFKEKGNTFLQKRSKNTYIAMFDINKFKHFNKIYDYEFCNEILKSFANLLKSQLPKESIICRFRGDTFVAIFSYQGNIKSLMNQIFKSLENLHFFTLNIHVNVAVGLYKITKEDLDINKILDKVDSAHDLAKGPYNSNYYLFDDSLELKILEEQQIELEMEEALKNHEFQVFYQPKVYVKNGEFAGAEALIRWQKKDALISPDKFIPLFEKNKFIIKLDLYVLEQVCKDMKEWKKILKKLPIISVNVSKEHFSDENFIEEYIKIVDKYEIDHKNIDLEITESATSDESIDIIKIIRNIKKKGFLVSLDDFGVGYSSLGMLQQLDIDIIKIDKTFIDQADLKSEQNIINYISLMSQRMGVKTIVEGIEKKDQVEFIQKLECDMIQGYYYSKPIPKKDFELYMKEYRKK